MLCDIKNIRNMERLGSLEQIQSMMDEICEKHRFTILQRSHHIFQPQGLTVLYLLAESHFSIHTFPEHNYAAIDLYTCRSYDSNDIYHDIANQFHVLFESSGDTITIVDRMHMVK
jgi:S-adenosylmethionine decarboxylase proenzyme